MKMAKASEADLNMAMELCGALDSLTGWNGIVPEAVERLEGDNESEHFDRDDREQCVRVLGYLLDLADRASLMRVVWGCAVMLDPSNKCVDPDADTIEHHPEMASNAKDAERYRLLRRGQHWSVIDGIGDTLRAEVLDAAIDTALTLPANDLGNRRAAFGASVLTDGLAGKTVTTE